MTTHGHVDDGGDAAGGGGGGGGLEALPLGPPPGLVDVHVAVHDARHQHQGPAVDHVANREGAAVKKVGNFAAIFTQPFAIFLSHARMGFTKFSVVWAPSPPFCNFTVLACI